MNLIVPQQNISGARSANLCAYVTLLPSGLWIHTQLQVVCVQLGYAGANRATVRAEFGRGTGTIWLDNVACTGLETALDLCASNGWGNHDCSHYEDAGAECEGEFQPTLLTPPLIPLLKQSSQLPPYFSLYLSVLWALKRVPLGVVELLFFLRK